jgi:hypothetical protein
VLQQFSQRNAIRLPQARPRGAVKCAFLLVLSQKLKLWKAEVNQRRSQDGGSGGPAMGIKTALVES